MGTSSPSGRSKRRSSGWGVGADHVREHRGGRLPFGVPVLGGLNDLRVEPEGGVVHEDSSVDVREVDRAVEPIGEASRAPTTSSRSIPRSSAKWFRVPAGITTCGMPCVSPPRRAPVTRRRPPCRSRRLRGPRRLRRAAADRRPAEHDRLDPAIAAFPLQSNSRPYRRRTSGFISSAVCGAGAGGFGAARGVVLRPATRNRAAPNEIARDRRRQRSQSRASPRRTPDENGRRRDGPHASSAQCLAATAETKRRRSRAGRPTPTRMFTRSDRGERKSPGRRPKPRATTNAAAAIRRRPPRARSSCHAPSAPERRRPRTPPGRPRRPHRSSGRSVRVDRARELVASILCVHRVLQLGEHERDPPGVQPRRGPRACRLPSCRRR